MVSVNKEQFSVLSGIKAGAISHVSFEVGKPLVDAGLIEVNVKAPNEAKEVPARLTQAGLNMVESANNATAAVSTNGSGEAKAPTYTIISGAVLPPVKRGFVKGHGGGAPTQYPFENMEIGQSFFVPVSEKHPKPVKTLGSTVSAQNLHFSEETGETREVTRAKRGPKNKAVYENGVKVMETVKVPVRKALRRFTVRPVKKGETYGGWVADNDGALVQRVELKA